MNLQIRQNGEWRIQDDHVLSILHEPVDDLLQFLSNNANGGGFEFHRNDLYDLRVDADILLLLVQQRGQA